MIKLVYNGSVPVSFADFAVEPGDSFFVPDHLVTGYTNRPDIDLAPEPETEPVPEKPEAAPAKPTKKATAQ